MSMLTLGRKVGESIMIGDDVEILLTSTGRGKAKISIIAPAHINIVRKELLANNKEENVYRSESYEKLD